MISSTGRRKLVQMFRDEAVNAWRTLATCAAGLAVVTLIAVVGVTSDDAGRGGRVAKTVAPAAAQFTLEDHEDGFNPLPEAMQAADANSGAAGDTHTRQQRKQASRVPEPRRSRFERPSERQSVVSQTGQPANRLSAMFR